MISLSLFILKIGRCQKSVDRRLLLVGARIRSGALEGIPANCPAPCQVLVSAFADEARQRVDRRPPLLSRGNGAAVFLLDRPKAGA